MANETNNWNITMDKEDPVGCAVIGEKPVCVTFSNGYDWFQVTVVNGELKLASSRSLKIEPSASNRITVSSK